MIYRTILLICFVSLFCNVGIAQPFTCDGQFYLSLYNDENTNVLYELNINADGSTIFSALPNPTGNTVNAIGYRKTDNYIYGIHPQEHILFRINSDGTADSLTTLQGIDNTLNYVSGDVTLDGNYLVLLGSGSNKRVIVFVDLTSPTYETRMEDLVSLTGEMWNGFSADIAFDPFTGTLYAYNNVTREIVVIDINTNIVHDNLFQENQEADVLGAFFFDAFGQLKAYGRAPGEDLQNTLYEVDPFTGELTMISTGPAASGNDGCSCPYTISINKEVSPKVTIPCTEVEYLFTIANTTGLERTGVVFEDQLPAGMIITEIVYNPYSGTINSGVGTDLLSISDMTIPVSIDSIIIRAEVPPYSEGIYNNQATLSNLPQSIGGVVLSDDPTTITDLDSTQLIVNPNGNALNELTEYLCPDTSLVLSFPDFADASYLWNDGSTNPTLLVEEPGQYEVTITDGCNDENIVTIEVIKSDIAMSLPKDSTINLGESIAISPYYFSADSIIFLWSDPLSNSLSCLDCETTIARPFEDVSYNLLLTNEDGCMVNDEIVISINKDRKIYIPNAFSPNDDGYNDLFYIQGDEFAIIKEFRIFNRWGAMVHEAKDAFINDRQHAWNGQFKTEQLNPGVFTWYAKIIFLDGVEELYEGSVTILK